MGVFSELLGHCVGERLIAVIGLDHGFVVRLCLRGLGVVVFMDQFEVAEGAIVSLVQIVWQQMKEEVRFWYQRTQVSRSIKTACLKEARLDNVSCLTIHWLVL